MKKSGDLLHVVAFDIPWPANYGGVIDIYYKIEALHRLGVRVILHAYEYGRERSPELDRICHEVHYYKRRTFKNPFYSKLPYIVASRNTSDLLQRLKEDQAPILFEGLHCCYYLNHPDLKDRFKMVRAHNVEHDYYRKLEEVEGNFFKKYFFRVESERLKKFENVLKHANLICAISPADFNHFRKKFESVTYMPAFHPNQHLRNENGRGDFILYHGNLAVGENDQAARFLVNEVFHDLKLPLVIAGSNPSSELMRAVEGKEHIRVIDKISSLEMLELIKNAHINVLPTFQNTGIKLKLINALFLGRFCVANPPMVQNTGLEPFCYIANTPAQFTKQLRQLWEKPFEKSELDQRRDYLLSHFDNLNNARQLLEIFSEQKQLH